MHENNSFNKNPTNHALYHALMEALIEDENVMDKGVADTGKKTKRRRTTKSKSSKKPFTTKETSKGKAPSKGSKTGKSATAKEPVKEPIAEVVMDDAVNTASEDVNKCQVVLDQPDQPWFNQIVSAIKDPLTFNDLMATLIDFSNSIELEYNMEECFKALTDRLDWNNPEGDHFPFDLTKPFPLKGHPGHLTVAAEYFFNNDLEFLKIKKIIPTLWSPTKVGYDKDALKGIKDWGNMRKLCVKKFHGYGHLEEIVVKRAYQQLYKFKEGDFVDLHLNVIKDMLLLAKSHHQKQVEDLQLGVESYQKKLNITKPQKTFPEIEFKELYTLSHKPPGVIYEDLNKQKREMRADELYKFSDGTLKTIRDRTRRCLGYNMSFITNCSSFVWDTTRRCQGESG
ncbi:hypothetical protein Tco_0853155 [Tanacetum coccineum]